MLIHLIPPFCFPRRRPIIRSIDFQRCYAHTPNVFDEMLQSNLPTLNSRITSYVRQGDAVAAWDLFRRMHCVRSDIDAYTFAPVLGACTMLLHPDRGKQVHCLMIKTGTDFNSVAKTSLMNMYSKYGFLRESIWVFEEMEDKDVVTWNALLSNYMRHHLPHEALSVFKAMRRENIEFSEFTLCSVLKACASLKAFKQGKQVHGLVVSMGRDLVVLSTALIDFYCSVGLISEALKIFSTLNCRKDDRMHNSLMYGCIRNRRYEEAFSIFCLMKPNIVALTSALAGCSINSDFWIGKQVHCVAIRQGFTYETQLCNALLNMYAKCGQISCARLLFDRIREKNVVSWTSMIDAYGFHGHGHEAVELFEKMMEDRAGVLPNLVTYLAVLSACAHSGLVAEGQKYFSLLRERYGLEPGPEHYACFINILGRAGQVEEAWSQFYNMIEQGIKPTAGVWIALLNACNLTLDVERGDLAAKHLLELEPNKASNLVLVSNFYAAIGRWDFVGKLRSIMITKGLVKEAGDSWITVRSYNKGAWQLSV